MRRWLVVLVLVACSLQPASAAALVHGTIYQWDTLEPLPNVLIDVNTTPHQTVLSKTGTYSLLLQNGTYRINMTYIVDGIPTLSASKTIAVSGNGSYVLDVLLFPVNETTPELYETSTQSETSFPWVVLVLGVLAVLLPVLTYAYRSGWVRLRTTEPPPKNEPSELPDDITQALEIIAQAGGRITQRELRERLGGSEARVSLLVSELVHRGLVEKVKVGRGNVIYLKR
ncbi:MAG: DUF7343 domain-containing protein [Methermicoccaceae archaeon]